MRIALLLALFGLAGCGTPVSEVTLPDGRPAYELRCGGIFDTKIDCNLKASEICPGGGYEPVDSRTGRLLVLCVPRRLPPSKPV
ncbi:MAG: hypothetical protein JOZ05_05700 [Acetobacteraceae bacterium]|nr:hypothetical protein [Acetobacteraceae bacterium]